MKNGADIEVESTPVIDLNRHGLVNAANSGDDEEVDMPGEWDNEKTEVYTDSEEEGNAFLIDAEGEQHPITAFPYVLGRGNECDFVLTGKGVSRKHAEIIFQSGRFVVNDLNSLNGIKVNGYKVSRVILEQGDVLKLGDITLTFSSGGEAGAEVRKQKKPSFFGKTEKNDQSVADDTFGASPGRNFAKGLLVFASVGAIAVMGWAGFQQFSNSQRMSEQIVSVPSSQPSVANQTASQNQATVSAGHTPAAQEQQTAKQSASSGTPEGSKPKAVAGSPPPSIALAAVKPGAKSSDLEPSEGSKIGDVPASKPKPSISREQEAASRLLSSADSEFLNGNAAQLFTNMTKYENNSRVYSATKAKIKNKHEELARLYTLYERGQKAFVSGDKQGAFVAWSAFLDKEGQVFGNRKSVYADQVTARVVDEYVDRGNQAAKDGKHHEAYKLWEKALGVGESVAAKIAIDNANTKSRQLYRKALRLEYVNSSKAKELWGEVVNLVPPGTEYHTKASSKLAWYERWGA